MTVVAELRGYADRQGKQAVYIRISSGNKRIYKRTQMKVLPEDWERGQVINTHPNYKTYNQLIRKLIYEAEEGVLTGVRKIIPAISLYKYSEDCAAEWHHTKASETLRQHRSEVNKLKVFAPMVNLSAINATWLNRYKAHLFSIGNSSNTAHKSLKYLRLIIRKAYREKLIDQNSFDAFEMPRYRDPEKHYLSKDQLDKIDKYCHDENCPKELLVTGTWFLIGVQTGLRFQDLKNFDKEKHIKNNRLIIYTSKTGELVSMPISDRLKVYFERLGYAPFPYTNVHYNRLLKVLGAMCGIEQGIHAHLSRHSAAMRWANAGLAQEVVGKLLGHNSLKSTAIYYKISGQRIDSELGKLES